MDESKRLIKIIKTDAYPIDKRIAAIEELISMDSQSASLGICHACFVKNGALMKQSCKAIREFSYPRFSDLINFILEEDTADTRYARKKFLDLLYKLRRRDMLRYIVQNAAHLADDEQKRRIIAPWLKQSQVMDRLVKALFSMPTTTARTLGKILKNMDSGLALYITNIMKSSPTKVTLKGLDILQEIAKADDIAPVLMKLFNSGDQKVKSKVTLMLGKVSSRLVFVKTALQDIDGRVRANALESIWEEDTPEAKEVFAFHLYDEDNRARANAAMGLYQMGDERGFNALMDMLHNKDKMMRASAAWVLGEVKEIRSIERLQTLQENDKEEIVNNNAVKALEKMDAPLLRLLKYFAALGTRLPSLEESEPAAVEEFLGIAKYLEDMNSENQTEAVETIKKVSPEMCTETWEILEGVAPGEDVPLAFLMASLYNNDVQFRAEATKVLGEDCDNELFFNHATRSPDAIVRAKALEALWGRQLGFASPILTTSLEDTDSKVVASAAIGLYKALQPSGAETILNMLNDEDDSLRANGAWATGEIKLTEAKPRLIELKNDPSELVRRNATEALEKMAEQEKMDEQKAAPVSISIRINHLDTSEMPLVWCCVSVLDDKGKTIEKLSKENFTLAEGSVPINDFNISLPSSVQGSSPSERPQDDSPEVAAGSLPAYRSSVAIVMDYSESMGPEDTESLEEAAAIFVSQMSSGDRGAIIKFSGEVSVVQPFTDDKKLLTDAIKRDYEGNTDEGTVLYDSVYEAVQLISDEKNDKAMIVLTDGDDSNSGKSIEELIGFANRQRTAIHTIGLGEDLDADVLIGISKATGGSSYLAKDQGSLINTYKSISDEIKKQYILSYMRKTYEIEENVNLQVSVEYGDLKAKSAVPLN